MRLVFSWSSLPLSFCLPLCLQECPSGVVNEDTFKQIYSQFFPHGGTERERESMCSNICVSSCLCLCIVSTLCTDFFFFSCRCQHLRTLPVQRVWLSTHRLHKVWGLFYSFISYFQTSSPFSVCHSAVVSLSIRTLWQLCPSCWGALSPRSSSGHLTSMISTEMDTSTKRCVFMYLCFFFLHLWFNTLCLSFH